MTIYKESRIKFSNNHSIKMEYAGKNRTGITLKITKKIFWEEELLLELLLTVRQET